MTYFEIMKFSKMSISIIICLLFELIMTEKRCMVSILRILHVVLRASTDQTLISIISSSGFWVIFVAGEIEILSVILMCFSHQNIYFYDGLTDWLTDLLSFLINENTLCKCFRSGSTDWLTIEWLTDSLTHWLKCYHRNINLTLAQS